MPPKKTNRRRKPYNRRKRYGKYRLARKKLPPLSGYGTKKLVRLRYVDNFTLNPAVGGLATYYFSANGMYDPDYTSTGHQPCGFDQAMTHYEHFTVIGSRIKVSVIPQVAGQVSDTQTPFIWGVSLVPTPSVTPLTDVNDMLESKLTNGQYRVAGVNTAFGSGVNQPMMSRSFSARKFFTKSSLTGQGQFSGTTAANPPEQAFFVIWGGPSGGASVDPDGQNMMVMIDYLAVLSEPKIIVPS